MQLRGLDEESVWEYENGFYWFSPPARINKMLAHYELYKTIIDIPGHICELGVYKAASLLRFATFRALLENDFSRKIIGFDAFGKFPTKGIELREDLSFVDRFEAAGGDGLSEEEVINLMDLKGFDNFDLVVGDIFETLPKYIEDYKETRISLLHLDMDVKEPTAFALDLLYERVVPGGLIVVDDYNSVPGATEAIDEFLEERGLHLKKLNFYNVPAFIRK